MKICIIFAFSIFTNLDLSRSSTVSYTARHNSQAVSAFLSVESAPPEGRESRWTLGPALHFQDWVPNLQTMGYLQTKETRKREHFWCLGWSMILSHAISSQIHRIAPFKVSDCYPNEKMLGRIKNSICYSAVLSWPS